MVVKLKKKSRAGKRSLEGYDAPQRKLGDILKEAIMCHQTGNLRHAETLYDQILSVDSTQADVLHLKGVIKYQSGNNTLAAELIRKAISINPYVSYYHNNLGNALFNMGMEEEASLCFREAVRLMPENAEAYSNLGNVMRSRGRNDEALTLYTTAIQIDPGHDAALNNMANLLKQEGKVEEAILAYEKALKQRPDSAEIHFNLGSALDDAGRLDESISHLRKAISLRPEFAHAHNDIANVYKKRKEFEKAAGHYKKAIALKPDFKEAHSNLGDLYRQQLNFEDSLKQCRMAVSLEPDFARGYVNIGNTLLDQGCYDDALEAYQKAIDLSPGLADAHYNRGFIFLLKGEMEQGWEEYEWRFKSREIAKDIGYAETVVPEWDGSRLDGKSILILSEQGIGDLIQFVRYFPFVKEMGGTVLFRCRPELVRLFDGYEGIDVLIEDSLEEAAKRADVCVRLLSLPRIFKTTVQTVMGNVPYLKVDRKTVDDWKLRVDSDLLKVGLVWSGSKSHKNDRNRSCKLSDFAPFAGITGVRYFSLQKEAVDTAGAEPPKGMQMEYLGTGLNDFYDTAAAIMNMDLVITVDTAVAHLAGSLGRPVWTLLPYVPDWRWMLNRDDTPWYPTMRLFRQPGIRDWESVIQQISIELRKRALERSIR